MDKLNSYADDRLINGCIYCGGPEETREHVPSRVFLDSPFPDNLPVVWACRSCNNSFSLDEEYLACLIESVIAGSTKPEDIRRPKISKTLKNSPALRTRIEAAKNCTEGQIHFDAEQDRVRNVLVKLARGHAAYELSQPCKDNPCSVWWRPLILMSKEQRDLFEECHASPLYGELGSRGMQRMLITQLTLQSDTGETSTIDLLITDWVEVQEGRYRYQAVDYGDVATIKIVIGEYLACEVMWEL